jgi:enamine deaminase RidA (YjgF/YER057c/UK114 family)
MSQCDVQMVAKYAGILHIGMRNMEDYSLLKAARNREGADPMNELMNVFESIAHGPIKKRAITNLGVLNEAYAYARPSSFSRGLRIDLNGLAILLISGTASIDENGKSVHIGDFRAQARRIFANISGLLQSEGCTWHDVVRTTCYPSPPSRICLVQFESRDMDRCSGLRVACSGIDGKVSCCPCCPLIAEIG